MQWGCEQLIILPYRVNFAGLNDGDLAREALFLGLHLGDHGDQEAVPVEAILPLRVDGVSRGAQVHRHGDGGRTGDERMGRCFTQVFQGHVAAQAEALVVYASLEGVTKGFVVPRDTEGLEVSERIRLMSLNALPMYKVTLKNVKVEASGFLSGDFEPVLAAMRVSSAALAVGVARAAFEYARDYAKERNAFGVKIAQKQAIAFMLAEMGVEIESARLLTWEAAWKLDIGKADAAHDAYLAATSAADMVMAVTDRAVQILGGHGYIRDHPVEMWMRNGRGFTTFTGLAIV